jgi:hypothetical protein
VLLAGQHPALGLAAPGRGDSVGLALSAQFELVLGSQGQHAEHEPAYRDLERVKHFLWHGNTFRAMQVLEDLRDDFEIACANDADDKQRAFFDRLGEFCTYIGRNGDEIPNYGERHRCGEPISTATAEGAVNQVISRRMVKKQQMRWSPRGAHLLLQVRTRVLNDDLAADFARWYPGLTTPDRQLAGAA